MDTALLVIMPIVVAALTVATFLIARYTEARKKGQDDGALKKDIEFIKETASSIKNDLNNIDARVDNHTERIVVVEQSLKSFHKRLDAIEGFSRARE